MPPRAFLPRILHDLWRTLTRSIRWLVQAAATYDVLTDFLDVLSG
jgi:hypothetical protein